MRIFGCTRRQLLALPASIAASIAAASPAWAGPALAAEERPVAGFDEVAWDASGELTIEQTGRERLLIEAEPHVLRRIVARVRDRRLEIGFAPGRVETTLPIRFKLELRQLRRLELRGSGHAMAGALRADELTLALHGSNDLRIDKLQARRVELRHAGAGDVRVNGGRVEAQRIVLEGSGTVDATALDASSSDVLLTGSGEVRVAAEQRLAARIDGSGDIVYRGRPQVSQVIHGAGDVRRSAP
jgi:hypothetical protein